MPVRPLRRFLKMINDVTMHRRDIFFLEKHRIDNFCILSVVIHSSTVFSIVHRVFPEMHLEWKFRIAASRELLSTLLSILHRGSVSPAEPASK